MIVSQYSAQSKIARFLNRLLRPFAEEHMQSTTFQNESNFMQKLQYYVHKEPQLRSTTTFCTIKITNFYTLDQHESMINKVPAKRISSEKFFSPFFLHHLIEF